MSIGIRINDLPMTINQLVRGLITLSLLTSHLCVYAQTINYEKSSHTVFDIVYQYNVY